MTTSSRDCLRCQQPFESGYLLDVGEDLSTLGRRHQSRWVQGQPEPSSSTTLNLQDRAVFVVSADRCPRCGTIELRAG